MSILSKKDDIKPVLPFDNLNHWIYCVCVVTFDLELGQAMECIYPKHIKLADSEKSNVNYLSFPDSNSGCMGDTRYHFRFRCRNPVVHNDNKTSEFYPDCLKPSPDFCYGYVNFRQVKDKSIRRGYFQKSVVVLSPLPFINLFYKVSELVALAYFDDGEIGLEVVCHNIDKWGPPMAGQLINLPLRGVVLQTQIPVKTDYVTCEPNGKVHISKSIIQGIENNEDQKLMIDNASICIIPSVHSQDCFTAFGAVVSQLQLLWELVLTNQVNHSTLIPLQ